MRTGTNIRLRADGRYEARYIRARDSRGQAIYGYCYGKTFEEAEKKRAAAMQRLSSVRQMNLLILGAGSHGREVKELAKRLGVFQKIAFLDDAKEGEENVIGPCRRFEQYLDSYPVAIAAVGNHELRMGWLQGLVQAGFVLPVLIHPSASVSESAEIGYGTVICAQANVSLGAKIGPGCIIDGGVNIERGARIAAGTHVVAGSARITNM